MDIIIKDDMVKESKAWKNPMIDVFQTKYLFSGQLPKWAYA